MIVQYQGKKDGKSTTLTIRINGGNLSKTSSNYELFLYVGDNGANQVPLFTTEIHQSLSNCLREIYLFRKHNHITFDATSEKIVGDLNPYDQVLYDFLKPSVLTA
ncbi:hypothetical protein [Flavobacterium eburneipallidum]|uniref:hypothetical protein n=1 Tax=Flavobacterium eburneipallidum TaxID=3003263 RepID=UPI0022AC3870|nr:hypothetical protein [Flavobacterium eburneipallidum]